MGAGGAQRVVSLLAEAWSEQGKRIAVITFDGENGDHFQLPASVSRMVIGGTQKSGGIVTAIINNTRRMLALRRTLKASGAPLVVSFIAATNVLTVMSTLGLKLRVVISERNDPSRQSLGRVWDRLRRWSYRYADLVTANSKHALQTMSAYVPQARLAYVPNPLFSQPAQVRAPEPVILNVGRLTPQKAQDILIDAFADVAGDFRDWRLVIAGEGEEVDNLAARAEHLNIADRVTFTGRVDPWPLYTRASIFALPSRFEGTPNALLEAMSAGVAPIISETSSGALDFVRDGINGLVVETDNVASLVAALRRLMADPSLREKFSHEARAAVDHLKPQQVIEDWDRVLRLT